MQTKNTETNVKQIYIADTFTLHNFIYSYGLSVTSYLQILSILLLHTLLSQLHYNRVEVSSWCRLKLVPFCLQVFVCVLYVSVCLRVRAAYAQSNLSLHWSLMALGGEETRAGGIDEKKDCWVISPSVRQTDHSSERMSTDEVR